MKPLHLTGNWKMNHTRSSMHAFLREYGAWGNSATGQAALSRFGQPVRLFVPAILLSTAQDWLQTQSLALQKQIAFGAQNIHGSVSGAFTAETSASMLQDLGVSWSLIGHSERRSLFAESETQLQARLTGALEQGIQVVYCIGETLEERNSGRLESVLAKQLQAISQVPESRKQLVSLAYEPVWAIGTGVTASPEQAVEAHQAIRKILAANGKVEWARAISILYGGSVSPKNVQELLNQDSIDGALVGGASWKVETWIELLQNASRA